MLANISGTTVIGLRVVGGLLQTLDGLLPGRQSAGGSASLCPLEGGSEKLLSLTVLVPLAAQIDRLLSHRAWDQCETWLKGCCTSNLPYLWEKSGMKHEDAWVS